MTEFAGRVSRWMSAPAPHPFLAVAFVFFACLWWPLSLTRNRISEDSLPYRYLPTALLHEGTFALDQYPNLVGGPRSTHYALTRSIDGALITKKPALPAILCIPAFVVHEALFGPIQHERERKYLGKLTMSLLGAAAAAVLTGMLIAQVGTGLAVGAGLGLFYLTPFWYITLDAWPHAILALANVVSLALLRRADRWWAVALMGFLQSVAIASRLGAIPVAVVMLGSMVIAAAGQGPKGHQGPQGQGGRAALAMLAFVAGALPMLMLLGIYNDHFFGGPFRQGFGTLTASRLRLPFHGLAGFLVSPAEGLFVIAPILAFAFIAPRVWSRGGVERTAMLACVAHWIYWSFYGDWWGGHAWGPRYMSDITPLLLFLVAMSISAWIRSDHPRRRLVLLLAALAALISLGEQVIGRKMGADQSFHATFDTGARRGSAWVWTAPPEAIWYLARGRWFDDP